MIIIYIAQILLLIFLLFTIKFKNNIWYVLCVISAFIPVIGILVIVTTIIVAIIFAFTENEDLIKNNKLNRWLYAGYFEKK